MALDDSRRKILQAGLELTREGEVAVGVTVRLQDAAQRAALTTGAAYKVWATQQDFRRDLAIYALEEVGRTTPERVEAAGEALVAVQASMHEFVRVLSAVDFESFLEADDIRLNYVLIGAATRDKDLADAARAIYEEQNGWFIELYQALLDYHQRKMRTDYEITDLATALSATADGFILQTLFQPDVTGKKISRPTGPGGETRDWYLFACVVEAVIEHFTEPISTSPVTPRSPPTR
jgi:hypothetical protein